MKKSIFIFLYLIVFTSLLNAQRVEMGKTIIISQPVAENLYATGNTIGINAPVYGDLVTAGNTITINDTIQKDILLAGGTVFLNSYVGDDVRCAAGTVYIKNDIKGDLIIAGGTVTIDKNVNIGGNILASGGDIIFNGRLLGSIRGAYGKFTLNGIVEKEMNCKGGSIFINGTVMGKSVLSAPDIEIGSNAIFNNNVHYWNNTGTLNFKQTLKKGVATYDPSLKIETGHWYYAGWMSFMALIWYVGTAIVMIFLTQFLFSKTMHLASNTIFTQTLKSFGYGLLYLVGIPVAMVIAFITLIGIPVGIILLLIYILTIALATVVTSVIVANWLNTKYNKNWGLGKMTLTAIGIFIVLKLLSLTVFLSWLVAVACLIAFGAILININWRKKAQL
jgi:hypothetical protein